VSVKTSKMLKMFTFSNKCCSFELCIKENVVSSEHQITIRMLSEAYYATLKTEGF